MAIIFNYSLIIFACCHLCLMWGITQFITHVSSKITLTNTLSWIILISICSFYLLVIILYLLSNTYLYEFYLVLLSLMLALSFFINFDYSRVMRSFELNFESSLEGINYGYLIKNIFIMFIIFILLGIIFPYASEYILLYRYSTEFPLTISHLFLIPILCPILSLIYKWWYMDSIVKSK